MDIRKLQRAIVDGLEDVKAHDIRIYNTEHLSALFERVIVASGTSNRQTKALAASVRDTVKSRGLPLMSVEGEANGEWIIVDCGAAVAHILQPAIRQYYNLEEIWGGKAVNMKLGAAGGFPSKARASSADDAAPASVAKAVGGESGRAKAGGAKAGGAKAGGAGTPRRADKTAKTAPSSRRAAPTKRATTAGKAPRKAAGSVAGKRGGKVPGKTASKPARTSTAKTASSSRTARPPRRKA